MPILARLSMFSMIAGLLVGFAYRELTRNFDGDTVLGAVHGHIFSLGMIWYLVVLLLDDRFGLSKAKYWTSFLWIYTIGLVFSVTMMIVRGLTEVWMTPLTNAEDHMIAGFAGIGHIILTIGLILFYMNLRRALMKKV